MANQNKKNSLGRGLSAILSSPETDITSKDISGDYVTGAVASIPIDKIETNPFQPRSEFEEVALQELASSIKEQGIIQPLTVRKLGYDKYQLISGERRLRAAKLAGLTEVPAYIRVANDEQMLAWSLIENIQRQDLNAIEVAISYNRLLEECNLTQDELSKQVGKNRATISNYVRLLKLPAEIQVALRNGDLSMGHARSLINIDNQEQQLKIARLAILNGLSVREIEALAKAISEPNKQEETPEIQPDEETNPEEEVKVRDKKEELPQAISRLQEQMRKKLSMRVELRYSKGKGSVTIPFRSERELDSIKKLLGIS